MSPLPVLTSCSARDIQVDCPDVDALDGALAHTAVTAVRMNHANHVLKEIGEVRGATVTHVPIPEQTVDS